MRSRVLPCRPTGIGKTAVGEYVRRAAVAGLSWPIPDEIDDAELERRLFPPATTATGAEHRAHIFVAALGASNYTYAEARWTETLPDWIGAHVNALPVGAVIFPRVTFAPVQGIRNCAAQIDCGQPGS
jgi:transposase